MYLPISLYTSLYLPISRLEGVDPRSTTYYSLLTAFYLLLTWKALIHCMSCHFSAASTCEMQGDAGRCKEM